MCNAAANLTDRVLPDAPVRQCVLSVPVELRFLLASNAQAFTALTRFFMDETLAWYERSAGPLVLIRATSARPDPWGAREVISRAYPSAF